MTIEVEIVVAGAVGELVASMLGGLSVERLPPSTVLITRDATLVPVLDRLSRAGADVLSVVAVPTPGG
jgi:hypothetical protein